MVLSREGLITAREAEEEVVEDHVDVIEQVTIMNNRMETAGGML